MRNLAFTILIFLIFGFIIPKKETIYIGKITTNNKVKEEFNELYVQFRIRKRVIATGKINEDGNFKISSNSNKEFDIYYIGIGVTDTYLKTIKPNYADTVQLSFQIPKKYKEVLHKVTCPKCDKYDKTIPISYGLSEYVIYKGKPNQTYDKDGKIEIYDGGCSVSELNAKWYCKRDKIKF